MAEETTVPVLLAMDELADEARVQAGAMRLANTRWAIVYAVVLGLLVLAGGFLVYELAAFTRPAHLATVAGDIVVDRIGALMDRGRDAAVRNAPEFIAQAEAAVVDAVPQFRATLEDTVRSQVYKGVAEALAAHDKALIEELQRLPDGPKAIQAAMAKPSEAQALYTRVHGEIIARSEATAPLETATAELITVRDRLWRLRDVSALSPTERAERRFLQLVLASLNVQPLPRAAPARPAKKGR